MTITESYNHTFEYCWENVTLASWKKYPSENRPDVLAVDIIDKYVDQETGILHTTRVVYLKDKLPKILQPILGGGYGICVEHATVDPKNKVMTLNAQNVSFQNIFSLRETCIYKVEPSHKDFTEFSQKAEIVAFPFGLAKLIEKFSADKIRANASQGREIMENTIQRVLSESREVFDNVLRETGERFDSFKNDAEVTLSETFNTLAKE